MRGFADTAEPEADGGPDLRLSLVRGVRRSFVWVVLLVLLGAGIGLLLGLLQPNRYVSEAKLSLRMGAREQLSSESLVAFGERQHVPLPTMVDELQMLSDVALYERVARDLGPPLLLQPPDPESLDDPSTLAPVRLMHRLQGFLFRKLAAVRSSNRDAKPDGEADDLRAATKVVRDDTSVVNEPGSSVIVVKHTSTSPELARKVVKALTDAFIERHRDQFSIHSLLEKHRGKLAEAKLGREQAANAYVEHVSKSGMNELEMQVPRLEGELGLLETELFEARVRGEEISRLRTALTNRLQGIPAEIVVPGPTVLIPNEEYETQLTLKRQLLTQKQEMLINNRPSEEIRRREKEFDRRIVEINEKLATLPQVVPQGAQMQENLGHAAMEARLVDLEVEDETLAAKLSLLETRLNAKKERLSELQKRLLTASMLEKDLDATRKAEEARYSHLLERFSVLEALESIDLDEEANLRMLQAPTLELEKVGPKRGGLLAKGLIGGIAAAIAFAVLRARMEGRLRHPDLFQQARGVPVLAVVPQLSSLRRVKQQTVSGGS